MVFFFKKKEAEKQKQSSNGSDVVLKLRLRTLVATAFLLPLLARFRSLVPLTFDNGFSFHVPLLGLVCVYIYTNEWQYMLSRRKNFLGIPEQVIEWAEIREGSHFSQNVKQLVSNWFFILLHFIFNFEGLPGPPGTTGDRGPMGETVSWSLCLL